MPMGLDGKAMIIYHMERVRMEVEGLEEVLYDRSRFRYVVFIEVIGVIISILVTSCFMWSGALDSSDVFHHIL